MIAITGASGHLGKLTVLELIKRGVKPADIVAVVRTPAKVADLAGRGVTIREANYDSREALTKAFAGVEKVLLVSGNEFGKRPEQHQNIIEAAKKAGAKYLAYTSGPKADSSPLLLMADHAATEKMVKASGLPYVILRNAWYMENYTQQLKTALQYGLAGAAGDGKVTVAARADYAAAAAQALIEAKPNVTYELGGKSYTLKQIAEEFSRGTGQSIAYHDMPEAAFKDVLVKAGLPEGFAHVLADVDTGIKRGDLHTDSNDLEKLVGRPLIGWSEVIRTAL